MEEKSKEVKRNLYENQDRRGKVEVDESVNKVKHQNLRRYNGENLKIHKDNWMKKLRRQ